MGYDNTSMVYLTISLSDPLRSMQAQIFADHLTLAQPAGLELARVPRVPGTRGF